MEPRGRCKLAAWRPPLAVERRRAAGNVSGSGSSSVKRGCGEVTGGEHSSPFQAAFRCTAWLVWKIWTRASLALLERKSCRRPVGVLKQPHLCGEVSRQTFSLTSALRLGCELLTVNRFRFYNGCNCSPVVKMLCLNNPVMCSAAFQGPSLVCKC